MAAGKVLEASRMALDQLRVNAFRSSLTILGLVVGVATVLAMSSIIVGIRSSVLAEMERAGPNNFTVFRFNVSSVTLTGEPPEGFDNPPITVDEVELIRSLDRVEATVAGVDFSRTISVPGYELEGINIMGRDVGWLRFSGGDIVRGTDIGPADVRGSRQVAILTTKLAERLFPALDPIGRRVRIAGSPFTVVGIYQPPPNIFASIDPSYAIVPYTSALKHLGASRRDLSILVVPADDASPDDAIDQLTTALRVHRGLRPAEANTFAVVKQAELAETFDRFTLVFFLVMIVLSSIGLMVGGIGVIAVMMISVTERTREIGVRMAVGATRREILSQFLIEAATLTVAGAAFGLALGIAFAWAFRGLTPIPATIPPWAVVASLAVAAVAGIAFGLYPAWRAARMDPVVALRHE